MIAEWRSDEAKNARYLPQRCKDAKPGKRNPSFLGALGALARENFLNLIYRDISQKLSERGAEMTVDKEFFNVKYKEGALDPKAAQLILFAVNLAIGHEHGAKLHLGRARELGASEDEIWETVVYTMRPVAANVRNFAKAIIAK
jgi:alkylhydroperoxidase/carboxymuconolactone decarboxylase family protein YurZ